MKTLVYICGLLFQWQHNFQRFAVLFWSVWFIWCHSALPGSVLVLPERPKWVSLAWAASLSLGMGWEAAVHQNKEVHLVRSMWWWTGIKIFFLTLLGSLTGLENETDKYRLTGEKHMNLFKIILHDMGATIRKWRPKEMVKPEYFYMRFEKE